MTIKIIDGSQIHGDFDQLLKSFMPFAQKQLGYDKPVDVQLVSDPENAKDPLGKTAYYDPKLMRITVFIDKRHVKDILRSLSHELVHHKQNCDGQLLNIDTGDGYAQKDPHLRDMEIDAEDKTNTLLFRDWTDNYKLEEQGDNNMNENVLKEAIRETIRLVQQEVIGGQNVGGIDEGAVQRLVAALRNDDEIQKCGNVGLVDLIMDKVKAAFGPSAVASESIDKNWARGKKDKQLFEELLTRWCK